MAGVGIKMDTNQPNKSPQELFATHDWIYYKCEQIENSSYSGFCFSCYKCGLVAISNIVTGNPYTDLWTCPRDNFIKKVNNLSCSEIKTIINSHTWGNTVSEKKNEYVFWKICEICGANGAIGRSEFFGTNDTIIDMENFLSCNETIIKDIIE
jgi:hypothetical protein